MEAIYNVPLSLSSTLCTNVPYFSSIRSKVRHNKLWNPIHCKGHSLYLRGLGRCCYPGDDGLLDPRLLDRRGLRLHCGVPCNCRPEAAGGTSTGSGQAPASDNVGGRRGRLRTTAIFSWGAQPHRAGSFQGRAGGAPPIYGRAVSHR